MTVMNAPVTSQELRSFRGLRVGVVGLGIEGIDAVRFLHREGAAEIVVSDAKSSDALRHQIQALSGIPFALQAGTNDTRLAERVDAIMVSQGVPDSLPLVQEAERRHVPVTSMMRLFLLRCPAPVIGITGSAGKSTTTSLVGEMFRAADVPVFVGGNIGTGLLSALDSIDAQTRVVLEISHTQLARTNRSPHWAAVLNVTPNHLDQFSWDEYVELKRNLVRHQTAQDIVVLPSENETAMAFRESTPASPYYFGIEGLPGPGATIAEDSIIWDAGDGPRTICPRQAVQVPGEHNLRNVLAAVAIGAIAGAPPEAMGRAIAAFRGIAHRLETVATIDGMRYIDDSIATAPERTIAALRAFDKPIVLLLGGREKRLPLDALAAEIVGRARSVICFGEAGPMFAEGLRSFWDEAGDRPPVSVVTGVDDAVALARTAGRPGDVCLLSPAGPSFDAYDNFSARGDHFAMLVRDLAKQDGNGEGGDDGSR
jgi:UDP-N-acetylmuramoylalanine--D-glutamate ligase